MTTTTHDHAVDGAAPRNALLTRLGSALAFFPLAVWTTWHLWENLGAWRGKEAWESTVTTPKSPLSELLVSLIVLAPLVFHTVWGVRRLFIMKPNIGQYRTFDNFKFIIQRLTAVGLLGFIPAHIWLARVYPMVAHGRHETFEDIAAHMRHHPPTLVVYLLGVLATTYHLANGLSTGGMTWGYATSPKAMKRLSTISILVFLVLLAIGYGAIFALWSHGANYPVPA